MEILHYSIHKGADLHHNSATTPYKGADLYHDFATTLYKGADLILLLDYFVFVIELEVVTIVGALLHKPRHFVLVKIYLTVIALIFIIKNIVCTKLTISFTHPCHLLRYLKNHIYCIQKECNCRRSQISPVGYRLQSSGFGTAHS